MKAGELRIAFTGASGVGKTSLAIEVAAELELPVIPELARDLCRSRGFSRIGEIPDQEGFKREVLELQIAREDELGSFVADRAVLDCWVLWQRWNICTAMTYDTENVYRLSRMQTQRYSHLVYIPPMFEPPEDDFRWTEPDYQRQVDRLIRMTLYEFGLLDRTLTLTASSLSERRREVTSWIRALSAGANQESVP